MIAPKFTSLLILLTILLLLGPVLYKFRVLDLSLIYAEDIISIIPGSANYDPSSQFSITRFFDNNFFPTKKNSNLTWYNADNVAHTILLSFKNGTLVMKPQTIEPEGSFSHAFTTNGYYNFSSSKYNWMKGSVFVTDDIASKGAFDSKNNAKIQLSWTPAKPAANSNADFKINFIDMATGKNMEHIDYEFYLLDSTGNEVFKQSGHSAWGLEMASYVIPDNRNYSALISIKGILFQPVDSVDVRFMILP